MNASEIRDLVFPLAIAGICYFYHLRKKNTVLVVIAVLCLLVFFGNLAKFSSPQRSAPVRNQIEQGEVEGAKR